MINFKLNINNNINQNIKIIYELYCEDTLSECKRMEKFRDFCVAYSYVKGTRIKYPYPSTTSLKKILTGKQKTLNLITLFVISNSFKVPMDDFILDSDKFKQKYNIKKINIVQYEEKIFVKSKILRRKLSKSLKELIAKNINVSLYKLAKDSNNRYIFELMDKKNEIIPTINTLMDITGENIDNLTNILKRLEETWNIEIKNLEYRNRFNRQIKRG